MTIFNKAAIVTLTFMSTATTFSYAKSSKSKKTDFCVDDGEGAITLVSSSSETPEGLKPSFDAFTTLLGGPNNGNLATSNPDGGHRRVNWDAPATSKPFLPFDMPFDFFAQTVTRGLLLESKNNEFRVCTDGETDVLCDSLNEEASNEFQAFSGGRIFLPAGGENEFLISFTDPNPESGLPATVEGFGAVFVNVDKEFHTKMTFFAESGCIIAEEFVKVAPGGLSFLGVISGEGIPDIFEIEVTLGKKAIDETDKAKGVTAMDDFLYSEPNTGNNILG